MTKTSPFLIRASVNGLFGEYDHEISVDPQLGYVIIYGPNGIGKTKFLEIIHYIGNLNGSKLIALPFNSASLYYSDGSELTVKRLINPTDNSKEGKCRAVVFTLSVPGDSRFEWECERSIEADALQGADRVLGRGYGRIYMEDGWGDLDDEWMHSADSGFSNLPAEEKWELQDPPEEMKKFSESVPSYLIETQRLKANGGKRRYPRRPRSTLERSRIREQSEHIRNLLRKAQTDHSQITQRLDRSFPDRVLSKARSKSVIDSDQIRDRYSKQNALRERLSRVVSVRLQGQLPLPEEELEPWALALLSLYLDDAKEKLMPFEDLLEKIELLEKIVNNRLMNKTLTVTAEESLTVRHSISSLSIDLDSLSSGEQHEIILLIDLLFNVPPGAVVLIDEPEISLHVAWQIAFLPDVISIAKLVGFRFIVATHSPQIIHDKWEHAYSLGRGNAGCPGS